MRETSFTEVGDIKCAILADGAFVVGNTGTGLTNYSYPTSPNAALAIELRDDRQALVKFASSALRAGAGTSKFRGWADYHVRNWTRLGVDPARWLVQVAADQRKAA